MDFRCRKRGYHLEEWILKPQRSKHCGHKEGSLMKELITKDTPVSDEILNAIAYLPTRSLSKIVEDAFFQKLSD
jgi:hypothetical protein